MTGRVELVTVVEESGDDPTVLAEVEAITGRGLVGDRYLLDEPGSHSDSNLTLIEREAHEYLEQEGLAVEEPFLRRNLVVTGIELNPLVGKEFTIGNVLCRGTELCHPCHYLESITKPGVLKAMVMRGGIRAEILRGGVIRTGDEITVLS